MTINNMHLQYALAVYINDKLIRKRQFRFIYFFCSADLKRIGEGRSLTLLRSNKHGSVALCVGLAYRHMASSRRTQQAQNVCVCVRLRSARFSRPSDSHQSISETVINRSGYADILFVAVTKSPSVSHQMNQTGLSYNPSSQI